MTRRTLEGQRPRRQAMDRCKNFFALGMCYWLYNRPLDATVEWIEEQVRQEAATWSRPTSRCSKAGYNYCDTTELFHDRYEVPPAQARAGHYRNITGNEALAMGLSPAAGAGRPAALPRRLPDHAGLRHPARARRATRTSASPRSRPRTRSPPSAPRSAPPSAAPWRSPTPAAPASRSRPKPWAWRS